MHGSPWAMLVKVNDSLIINTDAIVAANWHQDAARWRLVIAGHNAESPQIFLTAGEMDHIMSEVVVPQMVALLRSVGVKNLGSSNGEHQ
jgi:hypothetical protein